MMTRHRVAALLMVSILLVAAACAGRTRMCEPVPDRYLSAGAVYAECAVHQRARLNTQFQRLPPTFRPSQSCGRVIVEFVVDTNGVPMRETAHVVRSNDTQLQLVILEMLTETRYAPAMRDGARVRQLTSLERSYSMGVFSAGTPSSVARTQMRAQC